jgi:hypothetical protein
MDAAEGVDRIEADRADIDTRKTLLSKAFQWALSRRGHRGIAAAKRPAAPREVLMHQQKTRYTPGPYQYGPGGSG